MQPTTGTYNAAADTSLNSALEAKPKAYLLARARLYRAIVTLPRDLCPVDEPLHERIVFFDAPVLTPCEHLELLLYRAWSIHTDGWGEKGFIYNIQSGFELTEQGLSSDHDARLFEMGWHGDSITYADAARVDLLVHPILKARLLRAMNRIALKDVANYLVSGAFQA